MTFKEQADELINAYNICEYEKTRLTFLLQIETLIKAGEYFVDYLIKRGEYGYNKKCTCYYCKEIRIIQKSINKLKETIK